MSVPEDVTKMVVMLLGGLAGQDTVTHKRGKAKNVVVLMLRREREAQPRGSRRNGRRTNAGDEEALGLQKSRGPQRRFRITDDEGHDGALRLGQVERAGEKTVAGGRPVE